MNFNGKFGLMLILLVGALGVVPMPFTVTLSNPAREIVIYPNVLFAIPLILLGSLVVLYGVTAGKKAG